jgi:DNA invertase Pin-like site-specific DNA recombinase
MTCAIYIRKSREDKSKPSHRLTVQREQLPAHARNQGWAVEIYDDGHASAARGKAADLVERGRLERDIRAGRIQVVLCIELSRLSRDDSLQDYVAWLHLCSQHRVRLATPSRILDPGQHSDWMLLLMEGGFSSVEMRVLQARMKEGRAEAHRAGKYLSGNPPIPYRYDKGQGGLVVDPEQLPIFRRMMALIETMPAKQVATKTGIPHITVRRAIADDRLLFYRGLRIDPATGETIPGQWPAVIDADQAARIRAGRINKRSGYHRAEHAALLSNLGVLICGYCGRHYRAGVTGRTRSDGTRAAYYGCPGKDHRECPPSRMFQQHIIDLAVITNLTGTVARLEELRTLWQIQQAKTDPAATLVDLDQQERTLRQKKQRLVAAIADGIINWTDAKAQSAAIESHLAEIAGQRQTINQTQADPPDWDAIGDLAQNWPLLTPHEQRQIVRSTIEQIQIYAGYLIITYRFPRNPDGSPTSRVHLPPPTKPGRKSKRTTGS